MPTKPSPVTLPTNFLYKTPGNHITQESTVFSDVLAQFWRRYIAQILVGYNSAVFKQRKGHPRIPPSIQNPPSSMVDSVCTTIFYCLSTVLAGVGSTKQRTRVGYKSVMFQMEEGCTVLIWKYNVGGHPGDFPSPTSWTLSIFILFSSP